MRWLYTKSSVDYIYAAEFMNNTAKAIAAGERDELVWFLEHPHIFTYGALAKPYEMLKSTNVPIYKTNRGGKYTYHGPGQRIVYAMINVAKRNVGVKEYVRILEEWCISALASVNVKGFLIPNKIGVWVKDSFTRQPSINKIAAIGIRIVNGVTTHGIAINIDPDLSFFDQIVPCGVSEYGVTSLRKLGVNTTLSIFDNFLIKNFPIL
jgi:lipoyl(octanoyl) transferase